MIQKENRNYNKIRRIHVVNHIQMKPYIDAKKEGSVKPHYMKGRQTPAKISQLPLSHPAISLYPIRMRPSPDPPPYQGRKKAFKAMAWRDPRRQASVGGLG